MDILEGADLSNEAERARVVAEMAKAEEVRYAAVLAKAAALGIPVRKEGPGSRVAILHDFRGDEPLYRVTLNRDAAISSAANLLYPAPYNLNGAGIKVGVWDGGSVRSTHREITGRVTLQDAAAVDDHATHVAGTIGATGVTASAKGMAPAVRIDSYDWDDDYTEMTAGGAATAGDTNRLPISNHSYGVISTNEDMGRYETECATTDGLAAGLPFYQIFWAAGNEQDELTSLGGYQSITYNGLAKNVLTVGAVSDAVSGSTRSVAAAAMSYFSSWGPCDDGRIKPDVVANGMSVYSSVGTGDSAYDTYQGTSMATPSTAGSATLLAQLYAREFSNQWMRASLLKALLIHTADDLGTAGPDYKFGWGLINVKAAADVILAHKANLATSPRMITNSVSTAVVAQTNTFVWDGSSPVRATLCWTDPAGAAQSAPDSRTPNLKNNLDLRITAPNGTTVHMPYVMPFVGVWSQASMSNAATRGDNNVDNVERIDIATSNLTSGVYTITVTRDGSLTSSPQIYSLVLTGGAAGGQAPVLAPIGSKQVELGGNLTFPVVASDPIDGDSIVLSAVNLPSGAVFNAATNAGGVTNTFTWNNAAPTGTYSVTFRAVDDDGTNVETVAITVFQPPPAAPVSLWASATNAADFTAEWSAVAGATNYRLDVATNNSFSGGSGGAISILSENFSGFTVSSGAVDRSSALNTFMQTPGWTGAAVYENAGEAKLGSSSARGILTSPTLNLSSNGGQATFTFDSRSWAGDSSVVQVYVATDGVNYVQSGANITLTTTMATYTNLITNGTAACNVRLYALNAASERYYLDNWSITQSGGGTPSYVSGYSNLAVSGTSQLVAGLTAGATYHFRVRAANAAGTSANSATASVTTVGGVSAPAFTGGAGPYAATVGVAAVFTVSASGNPTPALALQGTTAAAGSYVFSNATGQLNYVPPTGDAGTQTFTFTASNSAGVATQVVSVTVNAPVAITGQPQARTNDPGTVASFTVTATGTAPLRYQWQKNAINLSLATNATYTLPAVATNDAGGYRCLVSNVVNVATSDVALLAVNSAPAFGANPGPLNASVGVATDFTVVAAGAPPPALALQNATATGGYVFSNAIGQLSYLPPPEDGGTTRTFTFTASNHLGVATQTVSVAVAVAPPAAPASVWASATNAADFTAEWSAVAGATNYRLDVATNSAFAGGGGGAADLFISEYFEGNAGNNKAVEIYNGTGAPVDLSNYRLWMIANGGTWPESTNTLSGTLADGDVYVVTHSSADFANLVNASDLTSGTLTFNGDDAVGLAKNVAGTWTLIDAVGEDGADPGTGWAVAGNANATVDRSLARKSTVSGPTTNWTASRGTTTADSQWIVSAGGANADAVNFGSHTFDGGGGSSSYVAGYSNLAVSGTSQLVAGLATGATYHFRVRAANAAGTSPNSATASVTTAASGTPPTFGANPGPLNATVDVPMAFTVTASGAPEPILALLGATADPNYYSFTPDAGRLNYVPAAFETGTQTFTFTASNSAGVATQTVAVVVGVAMPVPPTIDPFPPLSTLPNVALNYAVTATDPDSATVTFACSSAVSSATWTFNTNSGAFAFTPTAGQVGTNVFAFKAIDNTALESAWSNLAVVVNSAADQVAVSFGQTRIVAEEGVATAVIPVTLAYAGTATVEFRFAGPATGTAQRGVDFNCATTLVISGASSANLYVDIVEDALAEGPESVKVTLHPVSPATAGVATQANFYVRDNDAFAVVAANLTSGPDQTYRDSGNRILEALCPDVALIQEFCLTNGTSAAAYRAWVDRHFGTNFHYFVEYEPSNNIPNGIVSRWPILQSGEWPDTQVGDRDFAWAKVQLPGTNVLHAVSVHLKASVGYESTRMAQARLLTNNVATNGWLTNGYLVIGGDLNLQDRSETALAVLTSKTVTDAIQPADQSNSSNRRNTNSGRDNPYDLVLPSTNLNARHVPFAFYGYTFTNGLVFDTRIAWASGLPPPATTNDSNQNALPADTYANMQHMAVMKVFALDQETPSLVDPPQAFAATATSQTQISLTFATNAAGNDGLIVWDGDGSFSVPAGTPPAVGSSFAGGTVLYRGGVSPVNHAGLSGCATYYYKCWSVAGTNYSATGLETNATTLAPPAPTSVWSSATTTTNFTAAWTAVPGIADYRVDVSEDPAFVSVGAASDLLISEYVEGSSNEKYVEIFNGTGASVDLANYALVLYANGAPAPTASNVLSGPLTSGAVAVYRHSSATNLIGSTNGSVNYNGDDAVGLWKVTAGAWVDIFGRIGEDPGTAWTNGVYSTLDKTLVRKSSVVGGVTSNPASGFPTLATEWDQYPLNTETYLGSHVFAGGGEAFVPGYSNRLVPAATSVGVTGLTADTTYYFRVRAIDGTCASGDSPTGQVATVASAADQTISFPAIAAQTTTNVVGLSATASSGLAVSFAVGSGPATISGGTNLSFTGAGTVSIVASQAGNASWNPAPNATNVFVVSKATAAVTLGSLAQTFNGAARLATATTVPAGLTVDFTYNGGATAPTNAGSYAVTGTVNSAMYQGSAAGTLVVAQAGQTISFPAIAAQATTNVVGLAATASSGLPVSFAVVSGPAAISGGTSLSFTGAGTVSIVASQAGDLNRSAASPVTNTFTVSKATAAVTLGSLAQTYDGTARLATATTVPAGLAVDFTYDGAPMEPTLAGSYAVTGTVNDAIYQGSATGTLVIAKAAAMAMLNNLEHIYDGSPKNATVDTTPPGLAVDFTYDGSPSAPSAPGSYAVTGTINDINYAGSAAGTLVIQELMPPTLMAGPYMGSSVTRAQLDWHQMQGRPVLVTVTTHSLISGTPSPGMAYSPGNIIGNQTVLWGQAEVSPLVVTNLHPGQTYTFTAYAENAAHYSIGMTSSVTMGYPRVRNPGDGPPQAPATVYLGDSGGEFGCEIVELEDTESRARVWISRHPDPWSSGQPGPWSSFSASGLKTAQGPQSPLAFTQTGLYNWGIQVDFGPYYGDDFWYTKDSQAYHWPPLMLQPAALSSPVTLMLDVQPIVDPGSVAGMRNAGLPHAQIDLSWVLNARFNEVLIARRPAGTAALAPMQGVSLNVGHPLGDGIVIYRGSFNTHADAGLPPDTSFDYTFYSVNNDYYSPGVEIRASTAACVPPAPAGLAAVPATTSFTAQWEAAASATNYLLDVATEANFTVFVPGYENLPVGDVLSHLISGLTPGQTYHCRVRAQNECGSGANSDAIQVTLAKADQTIDFPALGNKLTTDAVGLAASASSGLSVSFAVVSGPATISGGTNLSFTGAGTVSIVASQVGDGNWNPAPNATNTFTVTKAIAAVTLGGLAQTFDGTARLATATTVPAGLAVGFTYNGGAAAPTNAGSYAVTGTVNDAIYQGSAAGTLIVAKASQTISFAAIGDKLATDVVGLAATASSGLPVSFAVGSGPATISGGTNLAFTGTGTVSIAASQAGDANRAAAADVVRTFQVTSGGTASAFVLSAAAVNVRENGEGRFFVRLTAPPATAVTAVVARISGDANLTVKSGGLLTFMSTNWSTWQAVTLAGADDADTANGTATFQIDLAGLAPASVTATELDDDVGPNLALGSSGATIAGGSYAYRANDGNHTSSASYGWTVWTNVPPGSMVLDLKVSANVDRIRLLHWNWDVRNHLYTIESSLDGAVWELLVDATTGFHQGWEDIGLAAAVESRYLRFTGVSNSANRNVLIAEWEVHGQRPLKVAPLVSRSAVNVRENGEGRFYVKLDAAPLASTVVTVAPGGGGDADLSVRSGGTLTFTPTNWSVWQMVTLQAGEDGDALNGAATFQVAVPGVATAAVVATELDGNIGTNLALAATGSAISGASYPSRSIDGVHTSSATYGFTTWTSVPPTAMTLDLKVPATISRIRLLNWDWDTRVQRYKIESSLDGAAWSLLVDASAGNRQGWDDWPTTNAAARYLRFTGLSNSVNRFVAIPEWEVFGTRPVPVLSKTAVHVRENGEGRFFVKLDRAVSAGITVTVARASGATNLVVKSGGTLVFAPTNWNVWQTVTLGATPDANAANGTATFKVVLPGWAELPVTATELDVDIGVNLALASVGSTISGASYPSRSIDGVHTSSATYGFTTWTSVPPTAMTLDLKIPATVLRVRLLNWDWDPRVHRYKIESSLDGTAWSLLADASADNRQGWDDWPGPPSAIRYLRFTGLSNSANRYVAVPEWEVYGPPALPAPVVSRIALNVRENGEGRFFVKLDRAPTAGTTVTVVRAAGDADLAVQNGAALAFMATNWNVWQMVTLQAAADEDALSGTATFAVAAPGSAPVSVTATELDENVGANLALASAGSTISGGGYPWRVIDGIHTSSANNGWTVWTNVPKDAMILDLKTAKEIARIRLLNWDWDYRIHRYTIEASENGTVWSAPPVVDASTGEHQGWEEVVLGTSVTARYLRFTGVSNSANRNVLIAELEVYGPAPGPGRKTLSIAQESEPISVATSDGPADQSGWNAVDGDPATAWVGQKPGGGYLVVEYRPTLKLSALEVDLAAGSLTNIEYLYSLDAQAWQPLPDDMETNPVALNFLWLLFPDDGSEAAPSVLEIRPNP